MQNRPDLRAAQQGVTAANSQYELQKAIGKADVTVQGNYSHVNAINAATFYGSIPLPIFNRNQGEIARARFAITQAQEQEKATNGQALTDVRDAYEGLANAMTRWCMLYPLRLSRRGAERPGYQRIRLQARRRQLAGFSGCRAQLSRHAAGLPAGAGLVLACAGTASRSGGREEPAVSLQFT